MKRLAITLVTLLSTSWLLPPKALASGFILVDTKAGLPTVSIAALPPSRPFAPIPIHGPRPVTRPLPANNLLLRGSVSAGLTLQSEVIKVDINDQVAKTYITQVFANDTDRTLAGTYLFPLPDDTTFSSFSLHIDGKPVEGKILEANEARQQYEEIVRRMVDPGLLEYADYKTVRARIFPIPAHGEKTVQLEYTQVLHAENGMLKYRFPLKTEGQSSPTAKLSVSMKLASSCGLRTIWSPSHSVSLNRLDNHQAKISLVENNTNPDKDFLLYYSVSDKELTANLLAHKDEGEYGYFLLTLTPPVQSKQVIGKDLVLVADTSGSMSGEKMEQSKRALKYVINALNPIDRFNLIEFNTDVERFASQLVNASPENKKAALSFIDSLEPRGGTNIADALKSGKAMLNTPSDRPAYLVFITDGEPTVGETDPAKIIRTAANSRQIRVFDFGVGYDVNTRLLNKLASDNHGAVQYVEPDEDLETVLSSFYQKIKSPVLSEVGIAYDGLQVKDVYPKEVKDIFAGTQVLLIGKYKGSGKATVRLTGKINGVSKAYSFPLTFAGQDLGHTYLPRLWAMRRIGHLTDVAQENGNNKEVVDEIIALSKKYGIISTYTSFLVTDPSENHRLAASPPPAPMLADNASVTGAIRSVGGFSFTNRPLRSTAEGIRTKGMSNSYGGLTGIQGQMAFAPAYNSEAAVKGKLAVSRAKEAAEFKQLSVLASQTNKPDNAVKIVEDKTFYLRDGFWTDSTFDQAKSSQPELISFGSQRYFQLAYSYPGIARYLAIGKQIILVYKGHVFKILANTITTG